MVQSQKQSPAGHREIIRRWEAFVRSHTPSWIPSHASPPTKPSRPHALLLLLLFPRTPAVQPDGAHGPTLVFLEVHYYNQLHSTPRISSLQSDYSNLKILISEFIYMPFAMRLDRHVRPASKTNPLDPSTGLRPFGRAIDREAAPRPPTRPLPRRGRRGGRPLPRRLHRGVLNRCPITNHHSVFTILSLVFFGYLLSVYLAEWRPRSLTSFRRNEAQNFFEAHPSITDYELLAVFFSDFDGFAGQNAS